MAQWILASANPPLTLTTFIAVVGIMIGPGPSPTQINLRVSESASTAGSLTESTATLLPTG